MNYRKGKKTLFFIVIAALGGFLISPEGSWQEPSSSYSADLPAIGKGSVNSLQANYEKWSSTYAATKPKGPVISLKWSKGLSSEFTKARGIAQFNMEKNIVSLRIKGLHDPANSDVWLVHNIPGKDKSVLPEPGDRMLKLGGLQYQGENSWLDAKLDDAGDFTIDMVVVARRNSDPARHGVLFGTTSLFQKHYHFPTHEEIPVRQSKNGFSLIRKAAATAGITPENFFPDLDSTLINRGRDIFFNETFGGNGRTCGTCHKEEDNMALGLKTIASLPSNDPLFIVEQEFRLDGSPNPLFNEFKMEKPALMRKLGLILENLDGFTRNNGELTGRVAMRAPQHVLSMRTTIAPPPALENDDGTLPVAADDLVFTQRTGWSGDGTPTGFRADFFQSSGRDLTGSLRDFATGAIIQHFPLSMERSAYTTDGSGAPRQADFRFATEAELDALEAFMLSLGRQQENQNLNDIQLVDEIADRGRLNYMGFNVFDANPNDEFPPLNCNACHFNGGANTNPEFSFQAGATPNLANGAASHNRSFGPQVERLADQPGDIISQTVDDRSVRGNCLINGWLQCHCFREIYPMNRKWRWG